MFYRIELPETMCKQSEEYLFGVANWLCYVVGCKIIFVGIGSQSMQMTKCLINRKNVYTAHIPKDTKAESIIGTVNAVTCKIRQTGEERQTSVVTPSCPESKTALTALGEEEIQRVTDLSSKMDVKAKSTETKTFTPLEVKEIIKGIEAEIKPQQEDVKLFRCMLLKGFEFMHVVNGGNGMPASVISGVKPRSQAGLFKAPSSLSSLLNRALSKCKEPKMVKEVGKVLSGGLILLVDEQELKCPEKTTMYVCNVERDVITLLQQDTDWALPAANLKRKRET